MTLQKERKVPVSALSTGAITIVSCKLSATFSFLMLTISQSFANIVNVAKNAIPTIVSESLYNRQAAGVNCEGSTATYLVF